MTRMGRLYVTPVLLVLASVGFGTHEAGAQGVRGWVGSTMRYVELQPVAFDGVYRTQPVTGSLSATQDLRLTAWGFGMRGLSATVFLRNRVRREGDDLIWPRSDDEFDALLGYVQLDRGRMRVRVGRQDTQSGLGFTGFDGGRVSLRFGRRGRIEAYGGRSLARGLRETLVDALSGVEDFFPDKNAYLVGLSAAGAVWGRTQWNFRYQREVLSDRSALLSERASFDVSTALLSPVRATASLDYDFAFERFGKGHVTLQYALPGGRVLFEVTGRRYVPYFELSTIWGFFNPVSYTGGEARLSWSPASGVGIYAVGGLRSYGDTETTVVLSPLEDDAWRAGGGFVVSAGGGWTLDGSYRVEWGNGAFLSSGDARARWQGTNLQGSLTLTSFQQVEEFRLGEGRARGGSLGAGVRIMGRTWVDGAASYYFHRPAGNGFRSDWDQLRGWMSVRVELGGDPGMKQR
jgi:hypothetical protein